MILFYTLLSINGKLSFRSIRDLYIFNAFLLGLKQEAVFKYAPVGIKKLHGFDLPNYLIV